MDAARGHGLQSVLHVSEDRGIAEPLRNSTDAHWAAEEDNAPKANGKLEGEDAAALGRESDAETGADRGLVGADCPDPRVGSSPLGLRLRKVPKPGMYPEGFSPYVMRPRQTSSLKNAKHIARLSRPEILQDLAALRCLSGASCSPSNPDTCIALDSPLNLLSPLLSPVASRRAGAQPSSTDFSGTMFSLATSSLGRSPISCAAASSASTVDASKDSESSNLSRLQGASNASGSSSPLDSRSRMPL